MSTALIEPTTQAMSEQNAPSDESSIAEYFKDQQRKHKEAFAKRQTQREELESKVKVRSGELKTLLRDRASESAFADQARAKGFDTSPGVAKLIEFDTQIQELEKDLSALQAHLEKLPALQDRNFEREFSLATILAEKHDCQEASSIASMQECYAALPVQLEFDEAGRPKAIIVGLGDRETAKVAIKGGEKRFAKEFRPKVLDWLPNGEATNQLYVHSNWDYQYNKEFRAFVDEDSLKLVLTRTRLAWQEEVKYGEDGYIYGRQGPQYARRESDFSDVADCLSTHIEQMVKAAGGAIELEQSYKNNPLAADLRRRVLSLTTPEARFKPSSTTPTSQEIQTVIKADWDAFIKCPWAEDVTGDLALLKYYAENGERPRFWSGDFEGHYGFRLRTRDHSWIEGEIYLENEGSLAPGDSRLVIGADAYHSKRIAALGRMYVNVKSNERDR